MSEKISSRLTSSPRQGRWFGQIISPIQCGTSFCSLQAGFSMITAQWFELETWTFETFPEIWWRMLWPNARSIRGGARARWRGGDWSRECCWAGKPRTYGEQDRVHTAPPWFFMNNFKKKTSDRDETSSTLSDQFDTCPKNVDPLRC